MRRLKPARDELATVLVVNNLPSMQEIDETFLKLIMERGKNISKNNTLHYMHSMYLTHRMQEC